MEHTESRQTWRVVIFSFLVAICMMSYDLNESFQVGPPQKKSTAAYEAEVYDSGPWREVRRLTSLLVHHITARQGCRALEADSEFQMEGSS